MSRPTVVASDPAVSRTAAVREVFRRPGPAEQDPAAFHRRRRRAERLVAIAVPVLFLAVWELTSRTDLIDSRFFPPPTSVAVTAVSLVADGTLTEALLQSVTGLAIGYALGVVVGLVVGTLTGMSRWLRVALEPLLSALYTVPKIAVFPLLLLVFGLGELPKILLIGISVFFYVWISTMTGLMSVPAGYREAASSFDADRPQMFRHVLLPYALPQVFVGLRLGAGVAVLVLVAVEFISGDTGVGHLIWQSWQLLVASRMYVGIVTIALLGVVVMFAVKALGRLLTPWDDTHDALDVR